MEHCKECEDKDKRIRELEQLNRSMAESCDRLHGSETARQAPQRSEPGDNVIRIKANA